MDLAELAAAMTTQPKMSGQVSGQSWNLWDAVHRSRENRSFTCAILFSDTSRDFPSIWKPKPASEPST